MILHEVTNKKVEKLELKITADIMLAKVRALRQKRLVMQEKKRVLGTQTNIKYMEYR